MRPPNVFDAVRFETTDLEVCEDCFLFIADIELDEDVPFGTLSGHDDWRRQGWQLHPGDSELDDTFTWNVACDCCGSTVSGKRCHVVAMRPRKLVTA